MDKDHKAFASVAYNASQPSQLIIQWLNAPTGVYAVNGIQGKVHLEIGKDQIRLHAFIPFMRGVTSEHFWR